MKILIATFLLAGTLLQAQPAIRKSPELAFTLPGQGGKLLSQYRGKVVALEFILTTCPHCQASTKVMTRMQEKYGRRGLQVVGVAVDPSANALVENFSKQYQVGFAVGYAPIEQMMSYMGFSLSDRPVVPQLVLIDRNGEIHYQTPRMGDPASMTEEVIEQRIEELLEVKSAATGRQRAAR